MTLRFRTPERPWRAVLALLFLNLILSWTNIWPTPWVRPDHRFSGELALMVAVLMVVYALRIRLGSRAFGWLAAAYGLLVLGRYVDLMAPSLFGRPINLYWDVPQLPRFVWVTAQSWPWWQTAAAAIGVVLVTLGLHRLLRSAWGTLCEDGLVAWTRTPLRRRVTLGVGTLGAAMAVANLAGQPFTWPLVSKPVVPVYAQQLKLAASAVYAQWNPKAAAERLPPSPSVESALALPVEQRLAGVAGSDVWMISLESFGAVMFDDPEIRAALAPDWKQFEDALRTAGYGLQSGFFEAPTIGGGSDLSHVGILSGVDLSVPQRHDLLITTDRPTLIQVFQSVGHRAVGLYASVYWPWPERAFYRFDTYIDGPALDYRGPPMTYWKIPDQAAWALAEPKLQALSAAGPQFVFFPLITTHFPFSPTPPLQSDWSRLLTQEPYDPADVARTQAVETNWLDMRPGYIDLARYTLRWLAQAVQRPWPRDRVLVFFGDHQPTANVAGAQPPWDVPVLVASRSRRLLERLDAEGLSPGLPAAQPEGRQRLGGLHDLTGVLLRSFAGPNSSQTAAPTAVPR